MLSMAVTLMSLFFFTKLIGIVGDVLDSTLSMPQPYVNFVKKKSDRAESLRLC